MASFSLENARGQAPLTVRFVNTSKNAETFAWDFGDGTGSTDLNPSHTYTKAESYTVRLQASSRVGGSARSDSAARERAIEVSAGPLQNLLVEPRTLTLGPQETRSLEARGTDSYGNQVTDLQVDLSATAGGTATSPRTFTAGIVAGTYRGAIRLTARAGSVVREATIDVIVMPGPLSRATLLASSPSTFTGETVSLQVQGSDQFGNAVQASSATWTATLGTASGNTTSGTFVAGVQGGTAGVSVTLSDGRGTANARIAVLVLLPHPKVIVLQGVDTSSSCGDLASLAQDTLYVRLNSILREARIGASARSNELGPIDDTDVMGFSYSGVYQNCATQRTFEAALYPIGNASISDSGTAPLVLPSYQKSATCLGVTAAAQNLDALVERILGASPKDTPIFLVGHSMGGMTAAYWLSRVASQSEQQSVRAVITLDSPLLGYDLRNLLSSCDVVTPAWQDIWGQTEVVPAIHQIGGTTLSARFFSIASSNIASNIPGTREASAGCADYSPIVLSYIFSSGTVHSCSFADPTTLSVIGQVVKGLPVSGFHTRAVRLDNLGPTPKVLVQGTSSPLYVTLTNTGTVRTTFTVSVSFTTSSGQTGNIGPQAGVVEAGQTSTFELMNNWDYVGTHTLDVRVTSPEARTNGWSLARQMFPAYLQVITPVYSGQIVSISAPTFSSAATRTVQVTIQNTGNSSTHFRLFVTSASASWPIDDQCGDPSGTTCELQSLLPGGQRTASYSLTAPAAGTGTVTWRLLVAKNCGAFGCDWTTQGDSKAQTFAVTLPPAALSFDTGRFNVPAGATREFTLTVQAGARVDAVIILWAGSTSPNQDQVVDISVRVYDPSGREVSLPTSNLRIRTGTHLTFTVTVAGIYIFRFDNSYSFFASKTVQLTGNVG